MRASGGGLQEAPERYTTLEQVTKIATRRRGALMRHRRHSRQRLS